MTGERKTVRAFPYFNIGELGRALEEKVREEDRGLWVDKLEDKLGDELESKLGSKLDNFWSRVGKCEFLLPYFYLLTLHDLREGTFGPRARTAFHLRPTPSLRPPRILLEQSLRILTTNTP